MPGLRPAAPPAGQRHPAAGRHRHRRGGGWPGVAGRPGRRPAGLRHLAGGAACGAARHPRPPARPCGRSGGGVAGRRARPAARPGGHVRHPGRHPRHPAGAWGAGVVAAPATRPAQAASHPRRPAAGVPCHRPSTRACRCCRHPSTTGRRRDRDHPPCRSRPGLPAVGGSGGDAQERAATNPVAALPCARTPLLHPLSIPLLIPLLIPPSATVGVQPHPTWRCLGWWRRPTPASRAQKPRATGRGLWGSCSCGGPLDRGGSLARSCPGRPPTNPVGGLPADNRGHHRHSGWSHG